MSLFVSAVKKTNGKLSMFKMTFCFVKDYKHFWQGVLEVFFVYWHIVKSVTMYLDICVQFWEGNFTIYVLSSLNKKCIFDLLRVFFWHIHLSISKAALLWAIFVWSIFTLTCTYITCMTVIGYTPFGLFVQVLNFVHIIMVRKTDVGLNKLWVQECVNCKHMTIHNNNR